ncbi:MAG: ABC transporter permease [Acidimicrobiia bacterium]|nr:ABC transporter permease [Acidimicrobiia bacterium]
MLIGVVSAVRQYKLFDRGFSLASYFLLSTPVFLLAILLKFGGIKFNDWIGTTVFYTQGEYSAGFEGTDWEFFLNRLQHLILPTLSIALGSIAFYSRYQRNSMLDVLSSDHLRTARAKGLTKRQSLFRHGLRVAISPMATFFAYGFGLLMAGAVFTETIYGRFGMGQWFVSARTSLSGATPTMTSTTSSHLLQAFTGSARRRSVSMCLPKRCVAFRNRSLSAFSWPSSRRACRRSSVQSLATSVGAPIAESCG